MEWGEEEEKFEAPIQTKAKEEEEEEEYEYEYDTSEDEGTAFALRHRPIFVPKVDIPKIIDILE